ncbi:hypothetical protein TSTA_124720 [Talaromyces stipitatus ATCC 10500]|uniref:Uncharacterized protein n=1 Tax=Talaromyces stipitatus (strain ATCC 10500 / CBS 375.48 / QM 6759 / NRRL 1006) TaxID=441959 RepID=B8MB52_TALSN|nr:uncharacterized protein TSTA_124720 [Talaromyces stipitatus ATCC 10500]EED18753.1 hypothetical protein TSTA_124720 [Talaromyces stipitatus ATCC 10500]
MSYVGAGDWESIRRFMVQREKMPPCKGAAGHTEPDGSRRYTLLDDSVVSNMAIFEIRYKDLIAWNNLKKFFIVSPRMDLLSCQEMRKLEAGRTDWYSSIARPKVVGMRCMLFGYVWAGSWRPLELVISYK